MEPNASARGAVTVRLFQLRVPVSIGQVLVRLIPREFELSGEHAILRKEGERLIIQPAPPRSLLALLATLQPIDDEFPPIPELPMDSVDL